jgi:hypothetical protein
MFAPPTAIYTHGPDLSKQDTTPERKTCFLTNQTNTTYTPKNVILGFYLCLLLFCKAFAIYTQGQAPQEENLIRF